MLTIQQFSMRVYGLVFCAGIVFVEMEWVKALREIAKTDAHFHFEVEPKRGVITLTGTGEMQQVGTVPQACWNLEGLP